MPVRFRNTAGQQTTTTYVENMLLQKTMAVAGNEPHMKSMTRLAYHDDEKQFRSLARGLLAALLWRFWIIQTAGIAYLVAYLFVVASSEKRDLDFHGIAIRTVFSMSTTCIFVTSDYFHLADLRSAMDARKTADLERFWWTLDISGASTMAAGWWVWYYNLKRNAQGEFQWGLTPVWILALVTMLTGVYGLFDWGNYTVNNSIKILLTIHYVVSWVLLTIYGDKAGSILVAVFACTYLPGFLTYFYELFGYDSRIYAYPGGPCIISGHDVMHLGLFIGSVALFGSDLIYNIYH